jgi:hypothetical protein
MGIGRRSPRKWWFAFLTIGGAMLALAGISTHESQALGGCVVACPTAPGDFRSYGEHPRIVNQNQTAAVLEHDETSEAVYRAGPRMMERDRRFGAVHGPGSKSSHVDVTRHHPETSTAVRPLPHCRVRVTRLHNGSILCCRDIPSAQDLALPPDANDDTASKSDDSSDDDDSQDDQNGDDDTDPPIVACLDAVAFFLNAPERLLATAWRIPPSFSRVPTFQPLRC